MSITFCFQKQDFRILIIDLRELYLGKKGLKFISPIHFSIWKSILAALTHSPKCLVATSVEDVNTAASQASEKTLKGNSIQQNCTFAAVWHFFNDLFSLYLILTLNFLLGSIQAWHAQFKCAKKQVSSVTTFFFSPNESWLSATHRA